jgi:thiol-disulfide isomerase/thioredoxin
MSTVLNNVKNTVTQAVTNKKFLIIIFLLILFIGLAFWVYTTYIAPKLNPEYKDNKEFISDEDDSGKETTATIYAFYTTWCPHCKTNIIAEDSGWKKTMDKYNGKKINGVTLTFTEIDGEKDEGAMKDFESTHKRSITAFPTIYLVKGDNVIEFSTDITQDNITDFLNTAL